MEIVFTDQAVKDIQYWKVKNDKIFQERVGKKLESLLQLPFYGMGKPTLLKFDLDGYCSKRINDNHRIVYRVGGKVITIISARFYI